MLNGAKTVLDILIEEGKLTTDQADQLRATQLSSGKPIDQIIKDSNLVSEADLVSALSAYNHIPLVSLKDLPSAPDALALIDQSLADKYQMLPFSLDKDSKRILVAMVNPLDLAATSFIEQKTGYRVVPHYALPSEIEARLVEDYNQDLSSDVTEAVEESENIVSSQAAAKNLADLNQSSVLRQAPVAKIVEQILAYAVASGASDIHIEPLANRVRVRFRIDGMLQEKLVLPKSVQDSLISRVKILAAIKIDEKRIPQDGRFNFVSDKGEVDLRVSTLPTTHGEKIVMRLLRKMNNIATLEQLGMTGLGLKRFRAACEIPHGIILVTGPTGSGKTTTLYSALDIVNKTEVNIMTLEDPVEYEMTGISQVQVNPTAGLTFASGLRSFLRQDPDIMMVGEIRDGETAGLAVQASLTGHLVFSTLHTNSAAGAPSRMIDMGVEPFLLSSSLLLIMAQRVCRVLNEPYKEAYKPPMEVIQDIYNVLGQQFIDWCQEHHTKPEEIQLYRGRKDIPPDANEYKGRVGIFEVMSMDEDVQNLILKSPPALEIEKLGLSKGMLLMKQDGYLKALEGKTTIEEVLRVAAV